MFQLYDFLHRQNFAKLESHSIKFMEPNNAYFGRALVEFHIHEFMHFYGLDSLMHEKSWCKFNLKYHFLTLSFSPPCQKETNYEMTEINFVCIGLLKQQNKL